MAKSISKELIIIGAGPAGLKAAEEAGRHKIDYALLDKGQPGQAWREIRPDMKLLSPCHPQRDWTSLSSKFPIWKLPVERPYCTVNEFVQYLDQYTDHFHLNMHAGCAVREVRFIQGAYAVTCEDETTFTAPVLIVATGIFGNPFIPDIPGVKGNPAIMHSHFYRGPQAYKNQRVLLVGAGNSAAEIAIELSGQAMLYMVSRKELQFFSDTKKLYHIRGISESYLKELISMEIIRYRPHQNILKIDGPLVHFQDWKLEVDKIIFATGYHGNMKLLKNFNLRLNKYEYPEVSYHGESIQFPNLFFAGPLSFQGLSSIFIHGFVKQVPKTIERVKEKLTNNPVLDNDVQGG